MRKQITSLLMALLMLLTLLPTAAWAEDTAADDQPSPAIIDQTEPEEPTTPAAPEEPAEPAQPEETAVPEAPGADEAESDGGGIALYSSASGQCGSNLTWTLNNGVLTISGTGAMWSFDNNWYGFYDVLGYEQADDVTSVEVKNGVTTIAYEAFRCLENMTSVTLPTTVTSIGCNAFLDGCDALTTINYAGTTSQWKKISSTLSLPLATKVVCSNGTITPALSGKCGTNVSYSISDDGVLTIRGTGPMTDYTYSSDNSDCPWHNVRYALKKIIVEEGVTSIGSYAFSFDIHVTDVTLPGSLKTIGNDAFWGCHGLTSVVIPEGVTTIGAYAFEQCTSIETITVPASATELGNRAFITWEYYGDDYYFALTDIYYGGSAQQWYDAGGGNAALTDVTVHFNGATGDIVDHGKCGANASWKVDKAGTLTISGTGDMYDYYPDDNDYSTSPWGNLDVKKIDVQEGITSIGAYAFCHLKDVTEISLPSTLTTIGQDALCDIGVSSLVIPDNVVSIGDYAFNGCDNLTTITLPSGLQSIGFCFIECDALETINFKDTMEQWLACGGGESTFPAAAKVVCAKGGAMNLSGTCGDNLTWTLDNSGKLTVSGTGAMYDYTDITSRGTDPAPWAYASSMIRSVEIGSGVTSIGRCALVDTNITSLTIPGSVTAIGNYGAYHNRYLAKLTLNEGLRSIGKGALSWNKRLTTATIPDGVTTIGEEAFVHCWTWLPKTDTYVGLTTVTIPGSVTTIGKNAFDDNFDDNQALLTNVNYGGIEAQWNAIGGKDAGVPSSATITYATVVGSGSCGTGAQWSLTSTGILIISGTGKGIMKDYAEGSTKPWESKGDVKQIVICEGVTHIGDHAFANSPATRVSLPESLTSIGTRAFASADITSLTIPGSVTTIGVEVFWNCSKLTSLTIRDGVTTIESAFGACTGLTELVLPDSVTAIGTQAFYSCTGLETVTFSKNLTSIGYMAFSGCTALEEVVFPDALTEIAQEAFRNCTGLNAITLGSGITTIDRMAFRDCAPDSVDYMGTAKQWDNVSVGIYNECLDDIRCITLGVITSSGAEPDIRDVAAIYDSLVGTGESLDARQAKAADVNQDGSVDVYDLQRLYECVALGKTL